MTEQVWMHLGLGSFHRAHQACYFNHLLSLGDNSWSFCAANIRADAEKTVQGMLKQGNRYTLETVSPQGECKFETISAISKVFAYSEDLADVIAKGADKSTHVISFTVTEAGYYLDAQGHLDANNEYIKKDLQGGVTTIYGVIAKILQKRCELAKTLTNDEAQSLRVTLLCCDNVKENGEKFAHGLREFLILSANSDTLKFFENFTTTPNTMVDRITQRPEATLPQEIKAKTGIDDCVPVMAESYIQWVVEDNFANGRPTLEKVGVELVQSVLPYEDAKLRILNASHSCLAWAGVLKKHHLVYECARDSELHGYAYDYVSLGVIPCLKAQNSPIDLERYRDTTLERFCNDHLRDGLERIAQDSFSKFYTFIKPTLLDCYRLYVDPTSTIFLAALYYVFLEELFVNHVEFNYQDSSFDPKWYESFASAEDPVQAYANTALLFDNLGSNPEFVDALRAQIERARQIKANASHHAA